MIDPGGSKREAVREKPNKTINTKTLSMVRCFFTRDLFDEKNGTLVTEFNLFKTDHESVFLPYTQILKYVECRIRNILADQAEAMYQQRQHNYSYGDFTGQRQLKALNVLPHKIHDLRKIQDISGFAAYMNDNVLPHLVTLIPSTNSRYYENYVEKLRLFEKYINQLIENPDVLEAEKTEKTRDFSLSV